MENELNRKYELMVIIDARLNQEEKDSIFKEIVDTVNKSGGKIINSSVWLDKHKLTFEIKKTKDGTYYLINYEADGSANEKVRTALKLNERILRYVVTKAERKVPLAAKS